MGEVCSNGFTARKLIFPPQGLHFRPRARRARGRKWGPVGGNFLCLRSAISFTPKSPMQKLHLYLGLFFFKIKIQEIIIQENWRKTIFCPWAVNGFSPKGRNDILKNHFCPWAENGSASPQRNFCPPEIIFQEKQSI